MKCHLCQICNGYGCLNELPGMGGFNNNINFIENCKAWNKVASDLNLPLSTLKDYIDGILNYDKLSSLPIRLGPMTGAIENVGYYDEKSFYYDIVKFCHKKGIKLSIGDGCPDEKLKYGIEAVKQNMTSNYDTKAAVFIKPYKNDRILERIEWAKPVASHIGIDIDSYNILTMREKVCLEKKDSRQLCHIKKQIDVPFVIKGVFTKYDIDLVKEVKPDICFISNHGGRVENKIGSTAEFLKENATILSNYCDEIWVDGGVRTIKDIEVALACGADQVLLGRPIIQALINSK